MRANGEPKIPVHGAAGAAIFAALQGLAMKPGEGIVKIHKKPSIGGGYTYEITVSDHEPPRAAH